MAVVFALETFGRIDALCVLANVYRNEAALEARAGTDYLQASTAITAPIAVAGDLDCKRYEGV